MASELQIFSDMLKTWVPNVLSYVLSYALSVAVVVSGFPLRANAAAKCSDAFGSSPSILARQSVDELPRWVNWIKGQDESTRARRIDRLIESVDPVSLANRAQLERFVSKLMIETYGSRTELSSWLRSKDARLEKRALDLVREKVLREGIGALAQMAKANESASLAAKLKAAWLRFSSITPLRLPRVENVELPQALFEKIVADGYDAHAREFEKLIGGKQTAVDAYNTFSRYFGVAVAIALLLYFDYDLTSVSVPVEPSES